MLIPKLIKNDIGSFIPGRQAGRQAGRQTHAQYGPV